MFNFDEQIKMEIQLLDRQEKADAEALARFFAWRSRRKPAPFWVLVRGARAYLWLKIMQRIGKADS